MSPLASSVKSPFTNPKSAFVTVWFPHWLPPTSSPSELIRPRNEAVSESPDPEAVPIPMERPLLEHSSRVAEAPEVTHKVRVRVRVGVGVRRTEAPEASQG